MSERSRYLVAIVAAVGLATVAAGPPAVGAEAFSSPTDVQPLLVGTEVPSVDVIGLDGSAVNLRDVVGDKKTVVIFYRGGW